MSRVLAFAVLILAAAASAAAAAPRYRVVDLGYLPNGVSASAQRFGPGHSVVGSCVLTGGASQRPVRWELSAAGVVQGVTDLQALAGATSSTAFAANADGWVVGCSNTAEPQPRPVLWRAGQVIDLDRGGDGNANVYAFDVNDAGLICGMITKSGGGGGWDAALWSERPGTPGRFDRQFLPLPAQYAQVGWAEASRVDESGRVFGRMNLWFDGDRAVIWQNDAAHTPVLLEPLPNSLQSMPGDMNDLGDAVGYTMYVYGMNRATRWSRDAAHTPSELPMWPGDNEAEALAVSDDGALVVGRSSVLDVVPFPPVQLSTHFVLWENGGVLDLGAQLEPGSTGWTIRNVTDMNADGWIAGDAQIGNTYHAVVLVPVPGELAVGDAQPSGVALAKAVAEPGAATCAWSAPRQPGGTSCTMRRGRLRRLADGARSQHQTRVWDGRDASGALARPRDCISPLRRVACAGSEDRAHAVTPGAAPGTLHRAGAGGGARPTSPARAPGAARAAAVAFIAAALCRPGPARDGGAAPPRPGPFEERPCRCVPPHDSPPSSSPACSPLRARASAWTLTLPARTTPRTVRLRHAGQGSSA
ncbi:MAG: hypothetical protein U0704_05200 [Candidatus Eisenbacteria bacterium]